MQSIRRAAAVLIVAVPLLYAGCREDQERQGEPAVPPGSVPAAPDVRPGTESAPGGVMPSGAEGTPGDRAMPTDTLQPGTTVTGLDTPRAAPRP